MLDGVRDWTELVPPNYQTSGARAIGPRRTHQPALEERVPFRHNRSVFGFGVFPAT